MIHVVSTRLKSYETIHRSMQHESLGRAGGPQHFCRGSRSMYPHYPLNMHCVSVTSDTVCTLSTEIRRTGICKDGDKAKTKAGGEGTGR